LAAQFGGTAALAARRHSLAARRHSLAARRHGGTAARRQWVWRHGGTAHGGTVAALETEFW